MAGVDDIAPALRQRSSGVYSQVVSPLITLAFVIASTRIMLLATETRRSW
jgi:hypothetical protein